MPSLNVRQQKVGKNFESAIRSSGLTRTALADQLGVHQSTFAYWYKRGVTKPHAQKTADILGIDVNEIMSTHKRKSKKFFIDELRESKANLNHPEPRTVNIKLLMLIAKTRLSAQQEATLLSLALTFLGEES
jgi:lambda repressor-like predicted transcriptional regulator